MLSLFKPTTVVVQKLQRPARVCVCMCVFISCWTVSVLVEQGGYDGGRGGPGGASGREDGHPVSWCLPILRQTKGHQQYGPDCSTGTNVSVCASVCVNVRVGLIWFLAKTSIHFPLHDYSSTQHCSTFSGQKYFFGTSSDEVPKWDEVIPKGDFKTLHWSERIATTPSHLVIWALM